MIPYIDSWLEDIEHPTDEQLWEVLNDRINYNPILPIKFKEVEYPYLWLYWHPLSRTIKIEFYDELNGEFLEYCSFSGIQNERVFSVPDSAGGDDFKIYAHFFISIKQAFEVVKDFIKTAKRSSKVQWRKLKFEDSPFHKNLVVNPYGEKEWFVDNIEQIDKDELKSALIGSNHFDVFFNKSDARNRLVLRGVESGKFQISVWENGADEFYAFKGERNVLTIPKNIDEFDVALLPDFQFDSNKSYNVVIEFLKTGKLTKSLEWINAKDDIFPPEPTDELPF